MAEITGYRDLTSDELEKINAIKDAEIKLGELWEALANEEDSDRRWLAIAKTHFQEGFMAFVRSIAKPDDVFSG